VLIKGINNVTKNVDSVLLNFVHTIILYKYYLLFPQKYEAALLLSTLILINVSRAANQHISMISEGSCDLEHWSNGC